MKIPDLLSRYHVHKKYCDRFQQLKQESLIEDVVQKQFLNFSHNW